MSKEQNVRSSWLAERFHYLAMWPVNLVRDLPRRLSRLADTAKRAVLGVLFLPAEFLDAHQNHEFGRWVQHKAGRVVDWLHRLVTQLFDLLGGPEIAQFALHFFTNTSPLSGDEVVEMAALFGQDGLRFDEIRVAQGGLLDLIFRINGNLAFATWHTINIPRTGRHTREDRSLIAHELTHVYQYENVGSRYLGEAIYMLVKTKRDCYDYGGVAGLTLACAARAHYEAYNREQQAMIVQDYYARQQRGMDVSAYEPFIAELRSGLL